MPSSSPHNRTHPEESRDGPRLVRQLHTGPEGPIEDVRPRAVDLASGHQAIRELPRLHRDLQPVAVRRHDVVDGHHLPVCASRLGGARVPLLAHPVRVPRDIADVGEVGLEQVGEHVPRRSIAGARLCGVDQAAIDGHAVAALAVCPCEGKEGGEQREKACLSLLLPPGGWRCPVWDMCCARHGACFDGVDAVIVVVHAARKAQGERRCFSRRLAFSGDVLKVAVQVVHM